MNEILWSIFTLSIQVSLLAVSAMMLARWIRPSANAQRWLACSGLLVIAALTAIAFLPTPKWSWHWAFLADASPVSQSDSMSGPTQSAHKDSRPPSHIARLDLAHAGSVLGQMLVSKDLQPPARSLPMFGIAVAILVGLGVFRFVIAFSFSRQILNQSRGIRCPKLLAAAERASTYLAIRQFECRESSVISDAAVVGVIRPRVILPTQWRLWTDTELASVMAHEAAHLANRDSLWRLFACVVETVHFYNPLVRLLTRHLAFTQELAADKLASSLVGNQTYVRSLSSLALSRDAATRNHSAGMNPVFSGYLIKRIEMLSNPQTRMHTEWWASKFVVAGAMLTFGCLGYVARSFASPQENSQTQTRPATEQSDAAATRIASRKIQQSGKPSPVAGMFHRERTDPDEVPENDEGLLKVRFDDLYENFETDVLRHLVNSAIAAQLMTSFNSPQLPAFDVGRVELLLGTCQLGLAYDATKPEKRNSIILGMDAAEFRLDGPVDLAAWMAEYVPGAKEIPGDGIRKFELPQIPALGPFKIPLAQKDAASICFGGFMVRRGKAGYSAERQLDCVLNHSEAENRSAWADAFRRIDGGIVAVSVSNTWFDQVPDEVDHSLPASEQKAQQAYRRIQNSIRTLSFGADVSADANKIGIRIEVSCEDSARADIVEQAVADLIEFGLADNAARDQVEIGPRIGRQFLTRSIVTRARYGDEFTVTLETAIDHPRFSGSALASFLAGEFK
ncbi:MAG: M56 family metallopeptidase [bacterium]|nr:M56 family metallopeptidase [bacterium]